MNRKRASPRIPVIRDTILQALHHSLSASRLSHMAQIHARQQRCNSFRDMAETTKKMIDALDSLHGTLQTLELAILPRDIDLSGDNSEENEPTGPITNRLTTARFQR